MESLTQRVQSFLLENLVLGKKSNQQTNKKMRTKTNYKPKANDKGKENNAIFFETWPSSVLKKKNELKYRRAVHGMSQKTFQMAITRNRRHFAPAKYLARGFKLSRWRHST